jgi:hypothetical protein
MFEVWFLDESRSHMEGVLENKNNLKPVKHNYCKKYADIPWIVASCDLLEVE